MPVGGIWFGAIEKFGEIRRFGSVRNNLVPKFVNSYCKKYIIWKYSNILA